MSWCAYVGVCVCTLFVLCFQPARTNGRGGGGGSRSCFQPLFFSVRLLFRNRQRRDEPCLTTDNCGVHSHGCCLNIKIHSHFSFHRPFVTCFFFLYQLKYTYTEHTKHKCTYTHTDSHSHTHRQTPITNAPRYGMVGRAGKSFRQAYTAAVYPGWRLVRFYQCQSTSAAVLVPHHGINIHSLTHTTSQCTTNSKDCTSARVCVCLWVSWWAADENPQNNFEHNFIAPATSHEPAKQIRVVCERAWGLALHTTS